VNDAYKTQSIDTDRDVEERLFAAYRSMTPQQKIDCWWDLWESALARGRASACTDRSSPPTKRSSSSCAAWSATTSPKSSTSEGEHAPRERRHRR
jgi:hypothetical protein